jgi:TrkA domain protein
MDVERVNLPGIGMQHVIVTARGRRVGVVSYHSGRRDLVVYDKDDPDTAVVSVGLSVEEANTLAELLGTSRIVERLAELHRQVRGLVSEQILVVAGSRYEGRTLGDTAARTRTGASIVAVVRNGQVFASPRPDFRFAAGDAVVVVGTAEGTAAVAAIFADG